jgi:hypothetical protein
MNNHNGSRNGDIRIPGDTPEELGLALISGWWSRLWELEQAFRALVDLVASHEQRLEDQLDRIAELEQRRAA